MAIHRLSAAAPYIAIKIVAGSRSGDFIALIDTGASMSAVHPDVVDQLHPLNIGYFDYQPVGDSRRRVKSYYFTILLDNLTEMAVEAIAAPPASPCQMLIGRDLMSRWLMTWDGPVDRLIISY